MKPINLTKICKRITANEQAIATNKTRISNLETNLSVSTNLCHRLDLAHDIASLTDDNKKMESEITSIKNELESVLESAQGKAKVRIIGVRDLLDFLLSLERKHSFLSAKSLVGTIITYQPDAERFAKAYKYTPESTVLVFEYRKAGIFLTDVYRANCNHVRRCITQYSDDAKSTILAHFSTNLYV